MQDVAHTKGAMNAIIIQLSHKTDTTFRLLYNLFLCDVWLKEV